MPDRSVSHQLLVPAPPAEVFALLRDPSKHPLIDGSGTLQASREADGTLLELGSRFGMDMRWGVPYRIRNVVVEYEPDRLIAWRHLARHRWRYELEPAEGGTLVTETFDWSRAPAGALYPALGFVRNADEAIPATLERLAAHFAGEVT